MQYFRGGSLSVCLAAVGLFSNSHVLAQGSDIDASYDKKMSLALLETSFYHTNGADATFCGRGHITQKTI